MGKGGFTSLCCSKYILHLLNVVDLVRATRCVDSLRGLVGTNVSLTLRPRWQSLGFCICLFAILLALKWGAWLLFWLWIPIMAMGGVNIMIVFTRCAVQHPGLLLLPPAVAARRN
jgi:hypothetical protein